MTAAGAVDRSGGGGGTGAKVKVCKHCKSYLSVNAIADFCNELCYDDFLFNTQKKMKRLSAIAKEQSR